MELLEPHDEPLVNIDHLGSFNHSTVVPSGPIGHLNDVRILHAEGTGKKSQESDSDVMNLEIDLVRPPTAFSYLQDARHNQRNASRKNNFHHRLKKYTL